MARSTCWARAAAAGTSTSATASSRHRPGAAHGSGSLAGQVHQHRRDEDGGCCRAGRAAEDVPDYADNRVRRQRPWSTRGWRALQAARNRGTSPATTTRRAGRTRGRGGAAGVTAAPPGAPPDAGAHTTSIIGPAPGAPRARRHHGEGPRALPGRGRATAEHWQPRSTTQRLLTLNGAQRAWPTARPPPTRGQLMSSFQRRRPGQPWLGPGIIDTISSR